MLYEEYYKKYLKLKNTKKDLNELEDKKISLMGMVDIKSTSPKDSGGTNAKEDKMLVYTAELEYVETNLIKNKNIIKEIEKQLKDKELELRSSKEDLDKVYLYKYIDKLKWYQICIKIDCEKTKTYNLINEIKKNLQKIKIAEKNGKK